jgi:hypothetical protein
VKIDWHKAALWLFNALLAVLLYAVRVELAGIRQEIGHVRQITETEIGAVNTRLNDHLAASGIPLKR